MVKPNWEGELTAGKRLLEAVWLNPTAFLKRDTADQIPVLTVGLKRSCLRGGCLW